MRHWPGAQQQAGFEAFGTGVSEARVLAGDHPRIIAVTKSVNSAATDFGIESPPLH
jgi:hypothetical protein